MAAIDVAGYVAELKDHAVDHGFHVHDERHFVETYSLRQAWEVDLHPEEACGGPLDLHLSLDVDPRALLAFEDAVLAQSDAGVGVKTSVNACAAKNFLGTFAPPFAVINNIDLLATLPLRAVRAGLAEAVKVALIRDDSLFD